MVDKLVNTEANTKRIQFVESCFGNSGQPLLITGRVLVGEGVLTKICRKKPKPRQFFLFNDILVYGNIVINKKKYNKQHIIPLEEVKIKSLPDEGVLKNGWLISSRSKSFAVYAATATEKAEWIAHINKCVNDLLMRTGKQAPSDHAAPWIPDSEASVCMHCKKSHFTLINRRHHCRNCGLVVCSMCANKKFLLPNQSSHPLRVCLTCYEKLSKSQQHMDCNFHQSLETKEASGERASVAAPQPGAANADDSSDDDDEDDESDDADEQRGAAIHAASSFHGGNDTTEPRRAPPPLPPPPAPATPASATGDALTSALDDLLGVGVTAPLTNGASDLLMLGEEFGATSISGPQPEPSVGENKHSLIQPEQHVSPQLLDN